MQALPGERNGREANLVLLVAFELTSMDFTIWIDTLIGGGGRRDEEEEEGSPQPLSAIGSGITISAQLY